MPTRTEAVMGTLVTIQVVPETEDASPAIDRAFGWFHAIQHHCTRFRADSELMRLCARPGAPIPVSPVLFEVIQFACSVAHETGGAFDPTVPPEGACEPVSYRDLLLDPEAGAITLLRPLTLDLGAVAKGLAVDTAARELAPFRDFAIDAGGDLFLGGRNPRAEPWSVGIRHPSLPDQVIETLRVSDRAVCTSGDYERGRHIRDPRTRQPVTHLASVTVVAAGAMLADALATAAFVLGAEPAIEFLDRMGVQGLILTPDLRRYQTTGASG